MSSYPPNIVNHINRFLDQQTQANMNNIRSVDVDSDLGVDFNGLSNAGINAKKRETSKTAEARLDINFWKTHHNEGLRHSEMHLQA